ncbi:MAG: helix-turn-helix domain-containing protein [Clostridia bacterium]|nr:helix-turn-helix domain-containing protein [Clostridia bacterium]
MNYRHLSIEERCCKRQYYNEGMSYRKIAELIGRSANTVCREINRNRSFMNVKPAYYPHSAQSLWNFELANCCT